MSFETIIERIKREKAEEYKSNAIDKKALRARTHKAILEDAENGYSIEAIQNAYGLSRKQVIGHLVAGGLWQPKTKEYKGTVTRKDFFNNFDVPSTLASAVNLNKLSMQEIYNLASSCK